MTEQDDLQEAVLALRRGDPLAALAALPLRESPEAHLLAAFASVALGQAQEAEAELRAGLLIAPSHPLLTFNLALLREQAGDDEEAARLYEACIGKAAPEGAVYGNLSNLYRKKGWFVEAERAARRAIEAGADLSQALNCLALAVAGQGLAEEADKIWEQAVTERPDDAFLWASRANGAADARDFEKAFACFAKARRLSPNPSFARDEGMARLVSGDWEAGVRLYEQRLLVPGAFAPPSHCPRYAGQALAGKTFLLMSEQGFGDTLHFCRYGKRLCEEGASLVWMVQPALVSLLQGQVPGVVLPRDAVPPPADFYLPLGSLPFHFGREADGKPYLTAPKAIFEAKGPAIGLVWAGSATHARDAERSIPLAGLEAVWKAGKNATFMALFLGKQLEDIKTIHAPVRDLSGSLTDFAATASVLAGLDGLVTVDTAVAHLAGAMGIRTALLLPYAPDWRWGIDGNVTRLYDSVRLYRQKARGAWDDPIRHVADEVATWIASKKQA